MFTGIIEALGKVINLEKIGTNLKIEIQCAFQNEVEIDQSIAHNGVCLTVMEKTNNSYSVIAVQETLQKTNLHNLTIGEFVNLERCLLANGRFDGHIVQGHVDTIAKILAITDNNGSYSIVFQGDFDQKLLAEKGSICVNGISLTLFNKGFQQFEVAIIPYTWENTQLQYIEVGSEVNIEYDIMGKYIANWMNTIS